MDMTMTSEHRLAFGPFQFDPATSDLRGTSGLVPLTPKALALLGYLATHPGRLVSKRELLDALWPDVFVTDGVLKGCVREIRHALGDDAHAPSFVETAHRRGYRFIAPVREVPVARATPPSDSDELPPVRSSGPASIQAPGDGGRVQYARSGDVNIAYQVLGSGPIDLVFVMGWVSHLEYYWREPSFARFLRRLARFSRLILFDKRGTGLSDPVTHMPTLEQRMDDVRAVMDTVGSKRAVLLGVSEGGPLCSLFAATYPNRTEALVMIGTYARRTRTSDYPWAPTDEEREAFCREILAGWGGPVGLDLRAPSMADDPAFSDWWAAYLRMGASPSAAVALTRMNAQIDIRHVLPTVKVPTLVLHRSGDRCLRVEEGRYVASRIPDARFVELPGDDHLPFVGDADGLLDEIERFVGVSRQRLDASRMLATILCVTSTSGNAVMSAAERDPLQALVRTEAGRFGGSSVACRDDRVTAVFDGPARAIRCARAISATAAGYGLALKIGVHTGECDRVAGVANGLAAAISSRIAQLARAGEVLVSRTVVDLVAGSGLHFVDRGAHELADGLREWRVFAVADDQMRGPRLVAPPLPSVMEQELMRPVRPAEQAALAVP
jgi:pimeloyl-ACP methyl ester carboxylesterase/DNA-binding winged helix-turn-helix (wHTH) protein